MKFIPTSIDGAFLIEIEPAEDERGYFGRTRSDDDFTTQGLNNNLSECSLSANHLRGTLRGMHYQRAPDVETKLVTCIRGSIFDAIIDLRKESPTYMNSFTAELFLENRLSLYIPPGVAHGFLTLEDHSYVQYQIDGRYVPDAARGVRWNDPAFDIDWPFEPGVISTRDLAFEDYRA
ncbi:MAG TPA: dTDP-4-dehydrorhamnose 3,5-epimerase family protein [Woeseiaceae bacterium]|nr:dTDP-4-dehydrorhamnose 3,5-epimerase family protein [Woeseiaceae bacterium]